MKLIAKAFEIATEAHKNQLRKPCLTKPELIRPYILHPIQVSLLLYNHGFVDEKLHAAGLLHDVLEDCSEYSEERLLSELGDKETVSIVKELTDADNGLKGKAKREAKIQRVVKTFSFNARIVLAGDILANIIDMKEFPAYEPSLGKAFVESCKKLGVALSQNLCEDQVAIIRPFQQTIINYA